MLKKVRSAQATAVNQGMLINTDRLVTISLNDDKLNRAIIPVLNEYGVGSGSYKTINVDENELKLRDINWMTKMAVMTFVCFPLTGIFALLFTFKMKRSFYELDYVKACKYKRLAQIFTGLNMVLALVTMSLFMAVVWLIRF